MKSSPVSNIKSNSYKTFVRPILEYAVTVWSPYLQYQIHQLDKVQRSAARFVMNDFSQFSSVTSMLNHLSWPTLEQRRNYFKSLMLFKLIHGLVAIPSITLTPIASCTCGHSHRYYIPPIRTEMYLHSFYPQLYNYGTICCNH